jgi:hypothetical protein
LDVKGILTIIPSRFPLLTLLATSPDEGLCRRLPLATIISQQTKATQTPFAIFSINIANRKSIFQFAWIVMTETISGKG